MASFGPFQIPQSEQLYTRAGYRGYVADICLIPEYWTSKKPRMITHTHTHTQTVSAMGATWSAIHHFIALRTRKLKVYVPKRVSTLANAADIYYLFGTSLPR